MTTYHVWLKGQDHPEVVQADHDETYDGNLILMNWTDDRKVFSGAVLVRRFPADEWQRWAIVDEAVRD